MTPIDYLDGFSGYGGFRAGLEQAGFKFRNVYFSEIDKHAIANYKYNYPNSIYAGSITTISRGTVPNIDLFTFGWPCQGNSIAGKREGLRAGKSSGLLYEAARVINEFKPGHFLAENVKGLSSVNKGYDYIKAIEILSFLNESCPQYDIEMQLFNTRWFLPQNRERFYFIGHLRGTGCRQVFPIGENLKRFNERATEATTIRCLTAGGNSGGLHSGMTLIVHNTLPRSSKSCKGGTGHLIRNDGIAYCLDTGNVNAIEIKQKTETKGNSQGAWVYDANGLGISLSSQGGGLGAKTGLYEINSQIRRLTPIECERLQGLTDDWTKYGNYNGTIKEISDTQRYKLCGNGVSVPVVKAIGCKLLTLNYSLT